MKKKLSLFLTSLVSTLLLVALLAVPASAATSGSCGDNLTFKQDWSIGWSGITYTVTVSGSGPMYDYTEGTAPWYSSNRTKTTSVVIERETSTVGTYAFYNYTGVTSISLPESVTTIGKGAFKNCTALTGTNIPHSTSVVGEEAFAGCTKLSTAQLWGNTKTVGARAFQNTGLTTMIFGYVSSNGDSLGNVTTIGESAFENCTKLTTVTFHGKATNIEASAFKGCTSLASITLPDSVSYIGENAFKGCTKLTSINIPASTCAIRAGTFEGCTALTEIVIPDSVTAIGSGAFKGCTSLASVVIPASVTYVAPDAFEGCIKLDGKILASGTYESGVAWSVVYDNDTTRFDIKVEGTGAMDDFASAKAPGYYAFRSANHTLSVSGGVTHIGAGAFSDFTNITTLNVPTSVTSIGAGAFAGCTGLTTVTIPSGVTFIGDAAFADCGKLSVISIPAGATVGKRAFANCASLTTFPLPAGATSVGDYAFAGCVGLTSVAIPSSVTTIGEGAFSGCTGITTVTVGASVKSIGFGAFAGCTSLKEITLPFVGEELSVRTHAYIGYIFGAASSAKNGAVVPATLRTVTVTVQTQVPVAAFSGCNGLTAVNFTSGCNYASERAFAGCAALADYPSTEAGRGLGYAAFADCDAIETVVLPSMLVALSDAAFANCDSLRYVELPEGLASVGGCAFAGCVSLDSMYLPVNVKMLGEYAFAGAGLVTVTLPDGMAVISDNAFLSCNGLTDVYFGGSQSDFDNMQVGAGNDCLLLAVVHCARNGVLLLTSTDAYTAWGLDFTVTLRADQLEGEGGSFILYYDPTAVSLLAYEEKGSGITVTEMQNGLCVDVTRVVAGEGVLTLTLRTSEFLAVGEHAYLSLDEGSENSASFTPLRIYQAGDVNMDGKVNSRDALVIKQAIVKLRELDAVETVYADIYADGRVSAKDALCVQQLTVQMDVDPGRHTLCFMANGEAQYFSVKTSADFTAVPHAPEGYVWSATENGYATPDFTGLTADTVFYAVEAQ